MVVVGVCFISVVSTEFFTPLGGLRNVPFNVSHFTGMAITYKYIFLTLYI